MSEPAFNWRPKADVWSIGQCFEHLNTMAALYLQRIDEAIRDGRERGLTDSGPFRYGWLQRWFVRSMEPPARFRVRTRKKLQPPSSLPFQPTVSEFLRNQERLIETIRQADGLHLARVSVQSPVVSVFRFSLGITFANITAHERRHIWQAEQVRSHPDFPGR
jgi:hypothetical protein